MRSSQTPASSTRSCSPDPPDGLTAMPCSSSPGPLRQLRAPPAGGSSGPPGLDHHRVRGCGHRGTGNSAPRHRLVQRDIAPVWDIVEAKIRSDAVYFPSFYILLVGAMVVGPEYNAIMGIALGIDKRNKPPILRGALALLAGFSAAVIVTLIFGLAIRWSGHTPRAYSLGVRPVSNLIENLNLFSLIVAVLAGIVRVVSLIEARSAALIGVWNRVIHSCSRCQPSGRCSVMCPRPDRALRAATLIRSRRSVAPRAFADARLARAPGGAQQV